MLGFRKNIFQRPKGLQGNLDTTIIKNSPDWFRIPFMYGTNSQRNHLLESSKDLQSVQVGRLEQSQRKLLGQLSSFRTLVTY